MNPIRTMQTAVLAVMLAGSAMSATAGPTANVDARDMARGRYLMKIAGCNDCHTPGYAQTAGKVPESAWLTGDMLGWSGEWGTTYPVNLRLFMQTVTEEQWMTLARTKEMRPPMPWFALRDMSDADLRATYRYVRALGPAGQPAPDYVPPGKPVRGPVIAFPAAPK